MLLPKQRRKFRPVMRVIILIILASVMLFGICVGLYTWKKHLITIVSPLAHLTPSQKKSDASFLESTISTLLQSHKVDYVSVKVQNDKTAVIMLKNNAKVILSTEKDIESQIASLQLTIANLTIEGKQFHQLDFRFDRPVVTF